MNIYDRDYNRLTVEEQAAYDECLTRERINPASEFDVKRCLFREYPKAARHHEQVFPNNYMDIVELENSENLNERIAELELILADRSVRENDVLRYIRESRSYFAIASLLHRYYTFGHHATHVFPEFPLGTSFRVDYLLAGDSSSGWHFVFVELESVYGSVTKANGGLGTTPRKGIEQTEEWASWLDANYLNLREQFSKKLGQGKRLPDEFTQYDSTRMHYLVVAGRRKNFDKNTYKKQRLIKEARRTTVLHYDNVLDSARSLIGRRTY